MIDKILEKFFGWMDSVCEGITNLVVARPKKKRKKCKDCKCNCHCKEDLHGHWYDGDPCTCEVCKC
jgi:hypothetical protein|tara:strand:- start:166 stop:363 length:198 start_codon:yes stop_codon:yes gene_type:complete